MAIRTHQRPAAEAGDGYRGALAASFRRVYDAGHDWWSEEPARRRIAPILLDEIAGGPADVLDAGTGRGKDASVILAAGHHVTGIDLVETTEWQALRERYPDTARFVAGDARELDRPAAYDAILDNGCLDHQQPHDYRRLLRAFHESLRPGGVLVESLPLTTDPVGRLHRSDDGRHSRDFTYDEAVMLLTQVGFAVTRTERVPRRRPGAAYLVLVARPRLR
jgi:SAM-dependent methyltransferase